MTPTRGAVGLTVWFTLLSTLVLFRVPVTDTFGLLTVAVVYSFFLLPVRWALILALLIQSVRAQPLSHLPHALWLQVSIITIVQIVLGLLSFVGWWELWNDSGTSRIGDRILGYVFHAIVPTIMIALLVRRARSLVRVPAR
jgi:hypothetical protein